MICCLHTICLQSHNYFEIVNNKQTTNSPSNKVLCQLVPSNVVMCHPKSRKKLLKINSVQIWKTFGNYCTSWTLRVLFQVESHNVRWWNFINTLRYAALDISTNKHMNILGLSLIFNNINLKTDRSTKTFKVFSCKQKFIRSQQSLRYSTRRNYGKVGM